MLFYTFTKKRPQGENLILGHGIDPKHFAGEEHKQPESRSEDELEEWKDQMLQNYNYSYETGKSELSSYFHKSFKPTSQIIEANQPFFSKNYGRW